MKNIKYLFLFIILLPLQVNAENKLVLDCNPKEENSSKVLCEVRIDGNDELGDVILSIPTTNNFLGPSYFSFDIDENWEKVKSEFSEDGRYNIYLKKANELADNTLGIYETILTNSDDGVADYSLLLTAINNVQDYASNLVTEYPNISFGSQIPLTVDNDIFNFDTRIDFDELDNIYDIVTNIPENISKLGFGTPLDNNSVLSLPFNYLASTINGNLSLNDLDVNIDTNNLDSSFSISNESICNEGEYVCSLYQDSSEKYSVYILSDDDEIKYYKYYDLGDLKIGINNFTINIGNALKFNYTINRGDFENILNKSTHNEDNTDVFDNFKNYLNDDTISINPNTSIFLSFLFTVLSIFIIIFMYIKYFRKKSDNH